MSAGTSHKRASESEADQYSEGSVARGIESRTAKLPSDLFLWSALGSTAETL